MFSGNSVWVIPHFPIAQLSIFQKSVIFHYGHVIKLFDMILFCYYMCILDPLFFHLIFSKSNQRILDFCKFLGTEHLDI